MNFFRIYRIDFITDRHKRIERDSKRAFTNGCHTFSQKRYLLAKAYYSAEFQTPPLSRYSNGSFKRHENTHPFSFPNIPQFAENQGFFESKQTVSTFPWSFILYYIAKINPPCQKWGKEFTPVKLATPLTYVSLLNL